MILINCNGNQNHCNSSCSSGRRLLGSEVIMIIINCNGNNNNCNDSCGCGRLLLAGGEVHYYY